MQRGTPFTRTPRKAAALATAALTLAAVGGLPAAPASAAPTSVTLFPTDALTVRDDAQLTGRRVALPTAACGDKVTVCGALQRINELDGFDLDPRLSLRFGTDVDVSDVIASTRLVRLGGGPAVRIGRVVYDKTSGTVYAHPQHQLDPATTYRLTVSSDRGLPEAATTFTTMSATDGLTDLRQQLDTGAAYAAAGISPEQRGLRVDAVVPTDGTTFSYTQDLGPKGGLNTVPVPSLAAGKVVFGSYLAPSWLREDRTITQVPTGNHGPKALRAERLPFVLVLPSAKAPVAGSPTAIYGHGFTGSDANVLLASLASSTRGVATVGTDVVGHGFGPRSTWSFTRNGTTRTVPAHARGIDLDGDGTIGSTEGSSTLPTGPAAGVRNRDGLRQTALDVMALRRAIGRGGLDVDGAAGDDLRATGVDYFGQSFGGIYGTMVAGADPKIDRAVLNVAGGPINEIVRLSPAFRPLLTQSLQIAGLLNSPSQDKGFFEESLPLRGQPPVLDPAPGALAIQDFLATNTWLDRSGSPETFAPLVRKPDVLFQFAFGDQTVPNPTSYTIVEAGGLFSRTALYRNDRVATVKDLNPHTFLLNLAQFPQAAVQGQNQVVDFFRTGQVTDPDGAAGVWQVPAPSRLLLHLNYTSPAFPNG